MVHSTYYEYAPTFYTLFSLTPALFMLTDFSLFWNDKKYNSLSKYIPYEFCNIYHDCVVCTNVRPLQQGWYWLCEVLQIKPKKMIKVALAPATDISKKMKVSKITVWIAPNFAQIGHFFRKMVEKTLNLSLYFWVLWKK